MQYSSLQSTTQSGLYKNFSASNLVKTGDGIAVGIIVASHTNGTLKLWDNTSAATTVLVNTITLAAGPQTVPLFGARFLTGLYITVGGTIDATLVYN